MPQVFSRGTSVAVRVAVIAVPLALAFAVMLALIYVRSDHAWRVGVAAPQPIPFRHDVHVDGLGLDCRYCHGAVERAAAAGMPAAETCMTCHAEIWAGLSTLEPLRTSLAFRVPVEWRSNHALPHFAFFHHGVHVAAGVTCATCHGPVERMAATVKTETLSMGWCLDCHRDAAWYRHLAEVAAARLTDCTVCHR